MDWVVISNEATAVGWRLAGARAVIADERTVRETFTTAQRSADLLFITAELASLLPAAMLDDALVAEKPLTAVIAGWPDGRAPPDIENEVQRALGIGL